MNSRQRLSEALTDALQALARQHHLSLNSLVQGAWAVLLSRYSGEEDVIFGVVVSGRPAALAGVESMVGLFMNTLPVRVRVSPEASLIPWLQALQAQQVEARHYEYSPLVQVQRWSDVPPGLPLFDTLLVFQNYPGHAHCPGMGAQPGDPAGALCPKDELSAHRAGHPRASIGAAPELPVRRL